VYAGIVLLATRVVSISGPVAMAASTLAAAALFNPLRRRVHLDAARSELLDAVRRSLEPAHVSVWISQRP
jgi:hypothetical protein